MPQAASMVVITLKEVAVAQPEVGCTRTCRSAEVPVVERTSQETAAELQEMRVYLKVPQAMPQAVLMDKAIIPTVREREAMA